MILIVEDESVSRRALVSLLQSSGYDTLDAASAEEALELVRKEGLPDVALVDLNLPGMNGLEFIRELEKNDSHVYSVLVTAAEPETVASTQPPTTPDKYFRKPLQFEDLLGLLGSKATFSN